MEMTYQQERAKYLEHLSVGDECNKSSKFTELQSTPVFSLHAKYSWNAKGQSSEPEEDFEDIPFEQSSSTGPFAQSALLGHHSGEHEYIGKNEPIMLNTGAPNSTFICGSQGSGKSYTLSCMLENCLLPDPDYGSVANPVAGLAFNYDAEGGDSLAEVATLCSRGIDVKVLVSASNFAKLKKKYMALPNAEQHLIVDTLAFRERDLDIDRMYKLMAFSETKNGTPLYEQVIAQVLRQMGMSGERFTMRAFEAKPEISLLDGQQKTMLAQRLQLLKSYLANYIGHDLEPKTDTFRIAPGTLTIVDLTDPFVNPATACTLFDICLSLFKQKNANTGTIVVLDEAHRYMNDSPAAAKFTDNLLTTVRMQRHTGTRVVIATQEPTISEMLLDLCSTSIVHRFNSPAWFKMLKEHVAGASSLLLTEEESNQMFDDITKLRVGESFVFSPTSFVCVNDQGEKKLGTEFMKMTTRRRKGVDSGKSKLAGEVKESTDDEEDAEEGGQANGEDESKADGPGSAIPLRKKESTAPKQFSKKKGAAPMKWQGGRLVPV